MYTQVAEFQVSASDGFLYCFPGHLDHAKELVWVHYYQLKSTLEFTFH